MRNKYLLVLMVVLANCVFADSVSNDVDKYSEQHLTKQQVNDFLVNIKKQANTESGLLQFIDYNYKHNGKTYYGLLNCSSASTHKAQHLPLTKEFTKRNYKLIFNKKLISVINVQTESAIFSNAQGFMFGDGDIWFNVNDQNKISIVAINSVAICPKK